MWRGLKIAVGLLALLALGWIGMTSLVRAYIFLPPDDILPPEWHGAPAQEVSLRTPDRTWLNGYFWAPRGGAKDIIVYFHGNNGSQQRSAEHGWPLTQGGRGVLIASYRGYGGNYGMPSEKGLAIDADAWIEKARRLLPPGGKLYLFGYSLGGGVALSAATRNRVDGVATLGTFTSVRDMAPGYARPFLYDDFDNIAAIRRIRVPVVLLHGEEDEVIPFAAMRKLAEASGGRAKMVPLPGERHGVAFTKLAPLVWNELAGEKR